MQKQIKRAQLLIELEKFPEAKKELEEIFSKNPLDCDARTLMLVVSQELDVIKKQEERVKCFLKDFPCESFGYYQMGELYLKKNQVRKARKMQQKAIAIAPFDTDYLAALGITEFNIGNYKKAEKLAKTALEIDPNHYNANYLLSLVEEEKFWKKDKSKTKNLLDLEYNEHAIEVEAKELMKKNKHKEALDILRQGILNFPLCESLREYFLTYQSLRSFPLRYLFSITRRYYLYSSHISTIFILIGLFILFQLKVFFIFVLILLIHIIVLIKKYTLKKQLKNGKI